MPFALTSALQIQRTSADLDARTRTAQRLLASANNLRDPARRAAAEKELEDIAIARQNLSAMDNISRFVGGDVAAADRLVFERSNGRIRLQPLTNGNYNIVDSNTGRVIPEGANLSRTGVANIMRSVYDDNYKQLVLDAQKRELTRQDDIFKTRLEMVKTNAAQLAQANREQAVEIVKAQLERGTPKLSARAVNNQDGSQAIIVTDERGVQQPYGYRFVPRVDPVTRQPLKDAEGKPLVELQVVPIGTSGTTVAPTER
jgi:hypothetical protein